MYKQLCLLVGISVCLKLSEVSAIAGGYGKTLEEHTEHCQRTLADSGRRKDTPCAFPFRFKRKLYDGTCTNIGDPDGKFWCSTKTNPRNKKHVGGGGWWGYCQPGCDKKPEEVVATTEKPRTKVTAANLTAAAVNLTSDFWKQKRSDIAAHFGKNGGWYHRETAGGDYLPNLYDGDGGTCGREAKVGYIVGGTDAKPGSYPFIAALGFRKKRSKFIQYACGGALINRRYVITAAHCHDDSKSDKRIREVVLGDHDLSTDPDCTTNPNGVEVCATPVQRFTIARGDVTVHEDWQKLKVVTHGNDIALVRLPHPAYTMFELPSTTVAPICLPWGELDNGRTAKLPSFHPHLEADEFKVMGWGRTNNNRKDHGDKKEGGAHSNILQQLAIPSIPMDRCKSNPDWKAFSQITNDRQLCAGGKLHQDSCSGDSGGPLMVQKGDGEPMYLRGIVSFGTRKCGKGFPGVYTNIEYYIDWIKANLKR